MWCRVKSRTVFIEQFSSEEEETQLFLATGLEKLTEMPVGALVGQSLNPDNTRTICGLESNAPFTLALKTVYLLPLWCNGVL